MGGGDKGQSSVGQKHETENRGRKGGERKDEEGGRMRGKRKKQEKAHHACRGSRLRSFLHIWRTRLSICRSPGSAAYLTTWYLIYMYICLLVHAVGIGDLYMWYKSLEPSDRESANTMWRPSYSERAAALLANTKCCFSKCKWNSVKAAFQSHISARMLSHIHDD